MLFRSELRVHPLMAGYGYTHTMRRFSIRGAIFGGYAWNSFSLDPAATELYRRQAGPNGVSSSTSDSISSSASNTWVIKPEVRLRYDVSRKVGLNVSAGYMVARPELRVRTPLGVETTPISADIFMLKFGVVYSVF